MTTHLGALIRVGGLPISCLSGFDSPLVRAANSLVDCDAEIERLRLIVDDLLYQTIPFHSQEKRKQFLSLKRSCKGSDIPEDIAAKLTACGHDFSALEQVLDLVEKLTIRRAQKAQLEKQITATRDHHSRHVAYLISTPPMRRGLAIASGDAATACTGLMNGLLVGRRHRKAVQTSLRYVTRAATKLSPFSTFTYTSTCGLSSDQRTIHDPVLSSHIRVDPDIFSRLQTLLLDVTSVKDRVVVTLNPHLVLTERADCPEGKEYLWYQPARYRIDKTDKHLTYCEEFLAVKKYTHEIERIITGISERAKTYREVLAEGITSSSKLNSLLACGLLTFTPSWHVDGAGFLAEMAAELETIAKTSGEEEAIAINFIASRLMMLNQSQKGQNICKDTKAEGAAVNHTIDELFDVCSRLSGSTETRSRVVSRPVIYEDVVSRGTVGDNHHQVEIDSKHVVDLVRSVTPLVRYTRLFDTRKDLIASSSALLFKTSSRPVPFLEGFKLCLPLFREYIRFLVEHRAMFLKRSWNPLELPEGHKIASARELVLGRVDSALDDTGSERVIDLQQLDLLLDSVCQSDEEVSLTSCSFVQRIAPDSEYWVLNRIKEGTGRFWSRFLTSIYENSSENLSDTLYRASSFAHGGEVAHYLDIQSSLGDSLNQHPRITRATLELNSNVPSGRPDYLGLRDLYLVQGKKGLAEIRDKSGQLYIPVFLGGGYYDYLPTLVKFLCAFGPTEMSTVFPSPRLRSSGDVFVGDRTVAGNLIIHRRHWRITPLAKSYILSASTDLTRLLRVSEWTALHEIPSLCFVMEQCPHPIRGTRVRPQYLDLTSPLFIELFFSILERSTQDLILFEALPTPEHGFEDSVGQRWAVEFVVDTHGLVERIPAVRQYLKEAAHKEVMSA